MDDLTSYISEILDKVRRSGGANDRDAAIVAAVIVADALERVSTRLETSLSGIEDRLCEIRDKLTDGGS